MDELKFADKYLQPYKIKGSEINPVSCPYCHGGRHRDKYTFFLNLDKHTFVCHRGSCGASGKFSELAKLYGERADYVLDIYKQKFDSLDREKIYKKPSIKLNKLSKQAEDYLRLRKISLSTATHFDLRSDSKGNIIFPYYNQDNEHVLNKIRIPRKFVKGKDKTKIWQEGGGEPVLFNMNRVDIEQPILLTEGEFDCLSAYESGYKNVVSIPFGTENMEWVNDCWEWLDKCKEFILWFDSDRAGKRAVEKAAKKLGIDRCKKVEAERKDANLVLYKDGSEKVLEYINNAKYFPIDNLFKMSDIKQKDVDRILYGDRFLDYFLGGCRGGELVVWTGKRGGGKSTFLNQTLVDTIEQKTKCFIYSGELSNSKVKQWLDRQIAGERYIVKYKDPLTGREEYGVHPEIEKIINAWYRDYLYCYGEDGSNDVETLIEIMTYGYKRYDIKRFIIDNLKTLKTNKKEDYFRQQGFIVNRLKSFAKRYDIHIDLVAHPKKTNNKLVEDEDVGGVSDIIDLADNVIAIARITEDMADSAKEKEKEKFMDNDTVIIIRKNREYGDTDMKNFYKFNPISKRMYTKNGTKTYSWERNVKDRNVVLDTNVEEKEDECPF